MPTLRRGPTPYQSTSKPKGNCCLRLAGRDRALRRCRVWGGWGVIVRGKTFTYLSGATRGRQPFSVSRWSRWSRVSRAGRRTRSERDRTVQGLPLLIRPRGARVSRDAAEGRTHGTLEDAPWTDGTNGTRRTRTTGAELPRRMKCVRQLRDRRDIRDLRETLAGDSG